MVCRDRQTAGYGVGSNRAAVVNREGRRLVEFVLGIVNGDSVYREWKEIEIPRDCYI